jgi:succinate dehydrogenase / fumarate reductase iron-sulfur subunit
MKFTLKIWRQRSPNERGAFVSYPIENINPEMSMLECLDVLNETLIERGEEPVAFDHDCREGICGACGFMINGVAHGPERATNCLSVGQAAFQAGRGTDHRTMAREGVPSYQRPHCGPSLGRSHH